MLILGKPPSSTNALLLCSDDNKYWSINIYQALKHVEISGAQFNNQLQPKILNSAPAELLFRCVGISKNDQACLKPAMFLNCDTPTILSQQSMLQICQFSIKKFLKSSQNCRNSLNTELILVNYTTESELTDWQFKNGISRKFSTIVLRVTLDQMFGCYAMVFSEFLDTSPHKLLN